MISDAERRDIARRLRDDLKDAKSNGYYCSDSEAVRYICDILRLRCSRCPHPWAGLEALADLIEPSGYKCMPGDCPINIRYDNDRIDRDALLVLADEMDTHWLGYEGMEASPVACWSRRIRESLGE